MISVLWLLLALGGVWFYIFRTEGAEDRADVARAIIIALLFSLATK